MSAWAYLNGRWIPDTELSIGVDDTGFLLGATVTERLRTFRGEVFRLDEHICRLKHSLEIVGLSAGAIASQVENAIKEFLARNKESLDPDDDWSIIAFATPGVPSAGVPTVCVHGYPLPFAQWARHFESGVRLIVSDVMQMPSRTLPPELKCRSRMHFYLADQRAAASEPGARAVLLDEDGGVAETTTANLLVYRVGEGLISPTPKHILFGVSLGVIQEIAAQLDIPFVLRPLGLHDLLTADEALLTSTSVCLLPVVACDGQPIGLGTPGSMYRRLLAAWNELVGMDIAEQARNGASRRP